MMEIILVYDYIGPNGYIPFIYTKDTLSKTLDDNQKELIKYNKFSPNTHEMLTRDLWNTRDGIEDNFYLVLIDESLQEEPLENVLSDTLNLLIENYSNNIRVIYFNHHVEMHTFI